MTLNDQPSAGEPEAFDRLLERAIEGDSQAVANVVEALRPYLLLIANQDFDRDLQAKMGPSDLVQSALLAAQQNFDNFRGQSPESFRAWVRKILHNNMLDAKRKFKKTARRQIQAEVSVDGESPPIRVSDQHDTPSRLSIQNEQADLLQQALAELPENYRQAIVWRNWEQHSFREIGQRLDIGEDAARKLWARALVRLQSVIATKYPGLDSLKLN